MPAFGLLRRARLPRILATAWFMALAMDFGGVHPCARGHDHGTLPVASAHGEGHHHGEPVAPTPAPPCDCLSQCCGPAPVVVPAAPVVALAIVERPAPPPGQRGQWTPPAAPDHLLPFSTPPPETPRIG